MRSFSQSNISKWLGFYVVVLVVLLIAPFDFYISFFGSPVKHLPQTNGVQILSTTGIISTSPVDKLHNAMVFGDGITIEAWLATGNITQTGPARIVSYSFDKLLRNFTLGQDKKMLVMRLRTQNTNLNGSNPEMRVEDIFLSTSPQHIVVTYDYFLEMVYINGKKRVESPGPGGNFSNWDSSYSLLLGNEATGNRPWVGSLFLVAVYNRALSEQEIEENYKADRFFDSSVDVSDSRIVDGLVLLYLFNEGKGDLVIDQSGVEPPINLQILTGPQITNQKFLSSPYKKFDLTLKQVIDIVGNIVIFIPLGFLFHAMMRSRYGSSIKITAFVFVLGSLFTLSIESLQYFSLTRFSSMTDVVNNMMGTAIGIVMDRAYTSFYKSRPVLKQNKENNEYDNGGYPLGL